MPYYVIVIQCRMTFGHAKIIDRIQQIGLTHAIQAHKAIDVRRTKDGLLFVILKIRQLKLFNIQNGMRFGAKVAKKEDFGTEGLNKPESRE